MISVTSWQEIEDIIYDRAWIWILSSSVQLDISRVNAANEWDVELNTKIKFISTSGHIIICFCLLMTTFLTIFRRFPKIFQNCSEGKANVSKHFSEISEDYRRFPKISEEAPMFRSYSNISKYFLRDYGTTAMVIILVTMVTITTVISSLPFQISLSN